jgi:imidazole glycerol-phosphate synthase subunit HisH
MTTPSGVIVVLDYGSGNLRSVERALSAAGANAMVTSDRSLATEADGLVVPGVGAFAACMAGLTDLRAAEIVGRRLAGGRPVLGICVGMQVLFESGDEHGIVTAGFGEWPGVVEQLQAPVLPHMGWNDVLAPDESEMFRGIGGERFYFVHSFAARQWAMSSDARIAPAVVTWAQHGERFVAAVEDGPLWATQFHPEKSGPAGVALLRNWIATL